MKLLLGLVLLAFAVPTARGQSIEIVSPKQAFTFAYGDAISRQIERDHLTNEMIARVTFSNYPYAGDPEPRCDETFDFVFPGLHFDAARNDFVTRTRRQVRFRSPRYTRIFNTPVTSSSRTSNSFCLNAAVRSPPY